MSMRISIGLENNMEGKSIAWALDYPGCFAYGSDGSNAIVALPRALFSHLDWMARHTPTPWIQLGDFDLNLVEVFDRMPLNAQYEPDPKGRWAGAWFRHDWKPLSRLELDRYLLMLSWSRQDLFEAVAPLSDAQLDRIYPNEKWSIRGILGHVAGAENWLLSRLDLGLSSVDLTDPAATLEAMPLIRQQLVRTLPDLVGVELVAGKNGEFWSPRKLLRRALWHELDHIEHIYKLLVS